VRLQRRSFSKTQRLFEREGSAVVSLGMYVVGLLMGGGGKIKEYCCISLYPNSFNVI